MACYLDGSPIGIDESHLLAVDNISVLSHSVNMPDIATANDSTCRFWYIEKKSLT